LNNHLGSSSLEVNEDAEVISYEEYYPYGSTSYQAVRSDIEVSAKRYRYTGMERDEETGLNYHTARYYALWLGRWASCDPLSVKIKTNLYNYCSNNPLSFKDLNGKDETRQWFAGILRGGVRVLTGGSSAEEIGEAYNRGSSTAERLLLAAQEAYAPSRAIQRVQETYEQERGRGRLEATLMAIDEGTGVGAEVERIQNVYTEHRGRGRLEATLEAIDEANPISDVREAWVDTAQALQSGDVEAAGESFTGAYVGTAAIVVSVAAPAASGTGIRSTVRPRMRPNSISSPDPNGPALPPSGSPPSPTSPGPSVPPRSGTRIVDIRDIQETNRWLNNVRSQPEPIRGPAPLRGEPRRAGRWDYPNYPDPNRPITARHPSDPPTLRQRIEHEIGMLVGETSRQYQFEDLMQSLVEKSLRLIGG
jgi:RHS repeat-associated protein